MQNLLIVIGFFVATLAFALVSTHLLIRFLKTLGTKNQEENLIIKWSSQTKPALGGIVFYLCFIVSLLAGFIVADESIMTDTQLAGLAVTVSLAFFIGLADDSYNTRPLLKFMGQTACAALAILTGIGIDTDHQGWDELLTILWIVGIMNSINMLDNMDGISTNTALFIVLFMALMLGFKTDIDILGFVVVGLVASLLGFLKFNRWPSKVFMGDSGSQFLGAALAILGISFCWNTPETDNSLWQSLVLAGVVFWSTINDTIVVTINRIRHGRSPFVGGRDHTTHNLVYIGLNESMTAHVFRIVGIINIAIGLAFAFDYCSILLPVSYMGITLALSLVMTQRNLKNSKFNYHEK